MLVTVVIAAQHTPTEFPFEAGEVHSLLPPVLQIKKLQLSKTFTLACKVTKPQTIAFEPRPFLPSSYAFNCSLSASFCGEEVEISSDISSVIALQPRNIHNSGSISGDSER